MLSIAQSDIFKARDLLLAGQIIAIPTETVYGLAANIQSEAALRKIFELKERPFFDPLIVHVSSLKQAKTLTTEWSAPVDFLARHFWPGPFTLVLPKADHVNPLITSGLPTVAIRFPRHPLALQLIEAVGIPLAAPSANKFARTSPSSAAHVHSEFPDSGLFVLDGGPCEIGLESTVVQVAETEDHWDVQILRPGAVTQEDLQAALSRWMSAKPALIRKVASENSPGHMPHHYMPSIPLIIVPADFSLPRDLETLNSAVKLNSRIQDARILELQLPTDAALAARDLYAQMRRLSANAEALIVKRDPQKSQGFWDAIWDRLDRAAIADLTKQ
jgi:L-threonylcarbamoyladenylate synthase